MPVHEALGLTAVLCAMLAFIFAVIGAMVVPRNPRTAPSRHLISKIAFIAAAACLLIMVPFWVLSIWSQVA